MNPSLPMMNLPKCSFNLTLVFFAFFVATPLMAWGQQVPSVIISVDWEGRDLQPANLEAMIALRRNHPDLKLVHFLNAAYFTKPGVIESEVRRKIQSVIRPGDELGLHIHGWHSLFEAAGIAVKPVGTFWPEGQPAAGVDIGHTEMIEDYSVEDLRRVIKYSVDVLARNGFRGIKTFRAGGWLAGPNVLEALVREGFVADSSAVPVSLLQRAMESSHLIQRLKTQWPTINTASEPFLIDTPAGPIREFPNTSGLADYVLGEQFAEIYKSSYQVGKTGSVVHYGFHQETAARYLPRVETGLKLVSRYLWWRRRGFAYETLTKQSAFGGGRCEDVF